MSREAPVIPIGPPRAAADLRSRSDDELMTLAAAGVVAAFGELVQRHQRPVRALCARMLGSAGPADDVAQEVFLEIWRACAEYEGRGQFRAYLFTTARNRCLNAARRRVPATVPLEATGERPDNLGAAPEQIEALLAAERRQRMDRLVSRLPPKLREAIWLRFAGELDYGEIAAVLGRSEEAVRSRVWNGLRRLRQLMGRGGRDGGPNDRSWT